MGIFDRSQLRGHSFVFDMYFFQALRWLRCVYWCLFWFADVLPTQQATLAFWQKETNMIHNSQFPSLSVVVDISIALCSDGFNCQRKLCIREKSSWFSQCLFFHAFQGRMISPCGPSRPFAFALLSAYKVEEFFPGNRACLCRCCLILCSTVLDVQQHISGCPKRVDTYLIWCIGLLTSGCYSLWTVLGLPEGHEGRASFASLITITQKSFCLSSFKCSTIFPSENDRFDFWSPWNGFYMVCWRIYNTKLWKAVQSETAHSQKH